MQSKVKIDEFGFSKMPLTMVLQSLQMIANRRFGEIKDIKIDDIKVGLLVNTNGELAKNYYTEINGQIIEIRIPSKKCLNLRRDYSDESERYFQHLEEHMGLPKGFTTPDIQKSRGLILSVLPDICLQDYTYLCGQIEAIVSNMEKQYYMVGNFRLSRYVNSAASPMYNFIRQSAIGLPYDVVISNPITGNYYKIGLNYQ